MANKRGTRRVRSASSAASSWSRSQRAGYAKMNASNSRRIATNRARRGVSRPSSSRRSRGGNGIARAIGNSNPIDKLFYEVGGAIRRATGGR